jgi:uncharacterized protein (TIGR02594 family)
MYFSKLNLSSLFRKTKKVLVSKTLQRQAYDKARSNIGLREKKGKAQHEAKILRFFKDVGHSWVKDDETAWCAAFAGAMLESVGLESTRKLDARSYLKWGQEVQKQDAKEGDIVVFWRGTPNGWQGHVAFFVRWTESGDIVCLGGNQSDQVSEQVYSKERLLGFRRAAE